MATQLMPEDVSSLVRISTAARLLGVSRQAFYMYVTRYQMAAHTIDGQIFVSVADVERVRHAREARRESTAQQSA